MKLDIDALDSTTGWAVNSPTTIETRAVPEFIAGLNSSSLLINFKAADLVRTATKTISPAIDVTEYESLVFSIWSRDKDNNAYLKASDFSYTIKLNDTNVFYVPVRRTFADVTIPLDDVTSISQIQIEAIHADEDFIIISEMVAEQEELPLDLLLATKENLEFFLEEKVGDGILVSSTFSGTSGTSSISLTGDFLENYAVIKIEDGVNSETHQIRGGRTSWNLRSNFDGGTLLNTYTDANVYVTFPVSINPDEKDVLIPGIVLWGITPDPTLRTAKMDRILDGFNAVTGTFVERVEGQILSYDVLIDCESRQSELIDIMTRQVRRLLAREILWVNGRKHDIFFGGAPTEVRPPVGIDIIPKIQYTMKVEAVENINDREILVTTDTFNISATIQ